MKKFYLTLLLSLFAFGIANAEKVKVGDFYYEIDPDGDTATLTSDVDIDYDLPRYSNIEGNIIIPSTINYLNKTYAVNEIGYAAFQNCVGITGIEMPNSIVSISWAAFRNCTNLKNVILSNSINEIGMSSFAGCINLTQIKLSNALVSIGIDAFSTCSSLTSIEIPESVKLIYYGAFSGCENLDRVEISSLEAWCNIEFVNIGESGNPLSQAHHLYLNGEEITELVIPESLTSIKDYTFCGGNFQNIVFPSNLNSIGEGSFSECSALPELEFPSSLTSIGSNAFSECNGLEKVSLPESLTSLGGYAFYNCSNLKQINLPSSLTKIENSTFRGCEKLTHISIPNSITKIETCAFRYCESLKGVFIPQSVIEIASDAFEYCDGLIKSAYPESLPNPFNYGYSIPYPSNAIVEEGILYNNARSEVLYVDLNYQGQCNLPQTVQKIGDYAFNDCRNLTSINFPSSLVSIGNNAFENSGLTEISFPQNLQIIGSDAFANTAIQNLTLGESIEEIGDNAFGNCPIVSLNVYTDASLQLVFWVWTGEMDHVWENLESVYFADNVTSIPDFCNAPKLRNVTLPASLKTIPYSGFRDCISLENITIPQNVIGIGGHAFEGCIALKSVNIPDGVTEISEYLFNGCTSLEKVYYSDNIISILVCAFQNCSSLRSINIPEGVKGIYSSTFQNCVALTEVLVPNSVETIAENAFKGCTSLRNIDLGTGVYSIGNYAFAECPLITDIHSMALNPPNADIYTFPTESYTKATVTVREQSLATYNRENPWYRFQNYLTVSGAISLSHYNVDMAGNEVFQLGVYGGEGEIKWSSSNPSVAYANECGLIVAMGITGSTVITATVDGEEINCNVTVSSPYRDPQTYTRTGNEEDLQPVDIIMEGISGNPPMVNVRLVPVGSKTIIDWTTSDPALASVQNGIVTVYEDGDVDFGVETENGLDETIEIDTKSIENAGIEEIFCDNDYINPVNVYDLSGRILIFNASIEQIKNLDKGFYIIKGKKILIK